MIDGLAVVSGFLVGGLVGITGVGGGALMTPILVMLVGVAPGVAVGTDLWFAAITKVFGVAVHHRGGTVDWPVFRRLCYGSLPAAVLTGGFLHATGGARVNDGLFVGSLGSVLMLTALAMLFKEPLHRFGRNMRIGSPESFKRLQPALTVAAGALLGVLVTLTSIGAGALGATLLLYLHPLRLTTSRLVGTDLAHAIPLAAVAGISHLALGNVELPLLGSMLLGSIPGVLLGALYSARASDRWLRPAIGVVLALVGMKMVISA